MNPMRVAIVVHYAFCKNSLRREERKLDAIAFLSESTSILQSPYRAHGKQQVFVANVIAEILDTYNVMQRIHVNEKPKHAYVETRTKC